MKRVAIESPLKGDRELNKLYARLCALDCLLRGESPYASHLFFDHPDLLDDTIQHERQLGIRAGFAWARQADMRVFYLDLDESEGMKLGREDAHAFDQPTEDRKIFELDKLLHCRFEGTSMAALFRVHALHLKQQLAERA